MKRYLFIFLWIYMLGFAILHFVNLDKIPLVWFDEVLQLDPAVNLVFKDGYESKIWPQTGTEFQFMAYMPISFMFNAAHLMELPFTVYMQRLPYAIYFLMSVILLIFTVRENRPDWLLALLVGFIFINDKTVFEVARSMRVDPLSLMFIALIGLSYFRKKLILQAVLASILVFVHPNLWILALVFFLDASIKLNESNKRPDWRPNLLWLIPLLFFLLFTYSINGQFGMLYTQLFEHASDHTQTGDLIHRLYEHFIGRFWPYYNTQPYIPVLIYFSLGFSIYKLIKRTYNAWDVGLILTHLYWLFLLAPFYRYNAVLLLISILSLLPHLKKVKINNYSLGFMLVLLLIHPANVMARHAMAITQQYERDPQQVIEWLKIELADEDCLIYGHDVAYYAVATDRKKDYMMFNLLPTKFSYNDHDKVFLLSDHELVLDGLQFKSSYHSKVTEAPFALKKLFEDHKTYRDMYLYQVNGQNNFDKSLHFMDNENVSVNRPKE